jgi:putative redox protein
MPFQAAPVTLELRSFPEGMHFCGHIGEFTVPMDSSKAPQAARGPTPVQLLMMALGGCTAMDVISILRKKRLAVSAYEVTVSGERRDEHPKVFTRMEVVHRVRGRGIPRAAVEEAVRLSHDRYCTVHGQIAGTAVVVNRIEIVEE